MNIVCIFNWSLNFWDLLFFISSIFFSVILVLITYVIIYKLKPNLSIESASINEDTNKLMIKVENKGLFSAVNIQFEACSVLQREDNDDTTKYFNFDKVNLLILPSINNKNYSDNFRHFKTKDILDKDELEKLSNMDRYLRVRVHAYHSFSGLGKAFEKNFIYKDGEFKEK